MKVIPSYALNRLSYGSWRKNPLVFQFTPPEVEQQSYRRFGRFQVIYHLGYFIVSARRPMLSHKLPLYILRQ